jgi:hypothetical protein
MRGISQCQTQHFQLSPQRQLFLERQLVRRQRSDPVERHIHLIEHRMELLRRNGNHAATLSTGTDKPLTSPTRSHRIGQPIVFWAIRISVAACGLGVSSANALRGLELRGARRLTKSISGFSISMTRARNARLDIIAR